MKRKHSQAMLLAALLSVVAAANGCEKSPDSTAGGAARTLDQNLGPEESFELIVETFRRGVEDVPIGFVFRDEEGHSMMTGKNEVSHKLIRPTKEGEPYKAIITVGSQSRYSIQRSTSEEENDDQSHGESSDNPLDDPDDTGNEGFDDELISDSGSGEPGRKTIPLPPEKHDKKVTRQADRQERKYELIYEDGRWTLVTKLDPETEQSIENAFKRALEMQI
jgi:hypothetical protein